MRRVPAQLASLVTLLTATSHENQELRSSPESDSDDDDDDCVDNQELRSSPESDSDDNELFQALDAAEIPQAFDAGCEVMTDEHGVAMVKETQSQTLQRMAKRVIAKHAVIAQARRLERKLHQHLLACRLKFCARLIQRHFRARQFQRKQRQATLLQKMFRGYKGRAKAERTRVWHKAYDARMQEAGRVQRAAEAKRREQAMDSRKMKELQGKPAFTPAACTVASHGNKKEGTDRAAKRDDKKQREHDEHTTEEARATRKLGNVALQEQSAASADERKAEKKKQNTEKKNPPRAPERKAPPAGKLCLGDFVP